MYINSPSRLQLLFSLNSQNKKNISKIKKLRDHSKFKEQENSPEAANNKTDLCSITDSEFKRKIVKMMQELRMNMKELRADISSNADYFRKELGNIRRNQEKLETSFAEI